MLFYKLILFVVPDVRGSLNVTVCLIFQILQELMVYVSYCFIGINNRLLAVKILFVFGGFWFFKKRILCMHLI